MCLEDHALWLTGWEQSQHALHKLPRTPVAELTAVDDPLDEVQWLGSELGQQLRLEGPVGVGKVVDGVQDAAELLDHLLRESWQDQVEAQAAIGNAAAVEG